MTYSNLWTTDHPQAGNNRARDLDDAIRRARLDVMERLLDLSGQVDPTADPFVPFEFCNAALRSDLDIGAVAIAGKMTGSGLTTGALLRALSSNSAESATGLPLVERFTQITSNNQVVTIGAQHSYYVITADSTARAFSLVLDTSLAIGNNLISITLKSGAAISLGGAGSGITPGSGFKVVGNAIAAVTAAKLVTILLMYRHTDLKAYEICRSAEITF